MIEIIIGCVLCIFGIALLAYSSHVIVCKKTDFAIYKAQEEHLQYNIQQLQQQQEDAIKQHTQTITLLEEKYKLYETNLDKAKSEYLKTLESQYTKEEQSFDKKVSELQECLDNVATSKITLEKEIEEIKAFRNAAIEAIKREKEIAEQKQFYSLQIPQEDKEQIDIIMSLESKLRDPRPIRMLVWSTFYLKRANELAGRVLPKDKVTGIYRITDKETQLSYIGQAKDVKERWREHMKCGLGIDTPAGNKLYAAMKKSGLENFTFELLEECSPTDLNKKEKDYIALYDSCNFGFNSNAGIGK